jgi:hypothetical protein
MSFRLSPGTLDSMADVFAPPRKRVSRSGGGKGKRANTDGTMLAFAVAAMLTKPAAKPASSEGGYRPGEQVKKAFGGGSHAAVTNRAIMTMERTARGVPEVMVRVTGRQHGSGHVLANMSYISRLGHGPDEQIDLHTSEGEVLRDAHDMQALARDWQRWESGDEARRQGATSLSMILSMPANTDPERLKEAALAFAREEFANRSWVAALHVDRDHPHVHLTVARRDHDGRRFHPDRDDLFRYRQRFAQKLRDRGIEANATPARARGIDPRHEPIAVRKIREQGEVPRIDKSRADRLRRLRETGVADPARAVLAARQAIVRDTFQRSIEELSSSRSLADQVTAQSLRKFVTTLPEPIPNSIRAMQIDRGAGMTAPAAPDRGEGPAATDPVAAALGRLKAATAEITARRARADDPVAAALARLEAAKAAIERRRAGDVDRADPLAVIDAMVNARAARVQGGDGADDPLATALARIEAMTIRAAERRAGEEAAASPGRDRSGDHAAAERSEEMRALLEQESRASPTPSVDDVEEFLRQTLDRVLAQQHERELTQQRDRSQDRSGPRR